MLKKIKSYLVDRFPELGKLKRFYIAQKDSVLGKESYSQHGEDLIVSNVLRDFNLSKGKYLDVGANHPTDISNTYLFYKKGLAGITIEPIPELVKLHRKFRPRDLILPIGISNEPGLISFNLTKFPVISSFDQQHIATQMNYAENVIWKKLFIPVLTLDMVCKDIEAEWYYFLSIDVEGLDFQVLQGATETLKKTYCLLIEFGTEEDKKRVLEYLNDFKFVQQIGCNLLLTNTNSKFENYKLKR